MKSLWIAGIVAAGCLSCQREESTAESAAAGHKPSTGLPQESAEAAETPAAAKPTKASERPAGKAKRIHVAEPVADRPGFVKSPFTGTVIDVRGIPAGTLVADPTFPADQQKHFRVPEVPEPEAMRNAPVATAVPGKAGFIFSPHDNKVIDVGGIEPGTVVRDPGSPPDEPRYLRLPGGLPPDIDNTD